MPSQAESQILNATETMNMSWKGENVLILAPTRNAMSMAVKVPFLTEMILGHPLTSSTGQHYIAKNIDHLINENNHKCKL